MLRALAFALVAVVASLAGRSELGLEPSRAVAVHAAPAGPRDASHRFLLPFHWPVRPFDRPHPIRGGFGEPRGLLDADIGLRGSQRALALRRLDQLAPTGQRVLHTGIDIVAPDGTPVYAVRSGIAFTSGIGYGRHVIVGRFGYWHLSHTVRTGTHVIAFRTVIGRVFPGQGHVHLTHYGPDWRPVNPLTRGGVTPYRDTAPPRIGSLVAFDPAGRLMPLSAVSGPVALAVQAYDVQSLGGLHTGLYRLAYSLYPWRSRRASIGPIQVFQFDLLPSPQTAGALYTLSSTRHGLCTRFWYRLTAQSPTADGLLHTERLAPGRYRLVVTAADERANAARRGFLLTVLAPGQAVPARVHRRRPPWRPRHLRCTAGP
jgi:hypothetical protein